MEDPSLQCQNCESHLKEQFEFCPNCGQKTNDELTISVLFYNTISNYFSFDARFLKSFIPLMIKPGYLARRFLQGKRLLYLHPAQMYLFISVVFFFLFSFTVRQQAETLNDELKKTFKNDNTIVLDSITKRRNDSISHVKDSLEKIKVRKALEKNKFLTGMDDKAIDSILASGNYKSSNVSFGFNEQEIDSLITANASDDEIYKFMGMEDDEGWFMRKMYAQVLKFYKARDGGNVLKAFYDTIPIALFFLLPIFALILKVFYYRKGRYAHHLVFSFYYFSYLFTVFSIIFGINMIWDIPDWIDWLVALSTFIYLFIALKRFYSQGWFLSFLKSSMVTFVFMAIVIPTAIIIIGLFAFMFY
ncbi:hypothetical protein A9Q86_09045 [Flavobacteriales bacterium 33_180_T64]|nr:hypothetical protein A9Q86_09045 [Flavobacteriales bacterium 33_180_T64]